MKKIKYVDLFAGIGGLRIPFDEEGGQCVFTSEKDPYAIETYKRNFEVNHEFNEDISSIPENSFALVPDHDLILAGFPCQPFSMAGKRGGFDDARGTLFFSIAKLASEKKPRVILLENVRGLRSHDSGRTFATILGVLEDLGYVAHHKILNARDFGLPQNRNRLFIVAIRSDLPGSLLYHFPEPTHSRDSLVLEGFLDVAPSQSLTISDRLWAGHRLRKENNRKKGKGFGYQLFNSQSNYVATISARYGKDGSEILIDQIGNNPRKISVQEAQRLQGFPEWFVPHKSSFQAYRQFGNAVPVPVVRAIAKSVIDFF